MFKVLDVSPIFNSKSGDFLDVIHSLDDLYQTFVSSIEIGVNNIAITRVDSIQVLYSIIIYIKKTMSGVTVRDIYLGEGLEIRVNIFSSENVRCEVWSKDVFDTTYMSQGDFHMHMMKTLMEIYFMIKGTGAKIDDLIQKFPPDEVRGW